MALGNIPKPDSITAKANHKSQRSEATNLELSVRLLQERTNKIINFKIRISTVTLLHIGIASGFAVFLLIAPLDLVGRSPLLLTLTCLASILIALYATLMTMGFDASRRIGNDLYSETSDAFQSSVFSVRSEFGQQLLRVLKRWLRETDMPLVPGSYGPAIYLLLNILATVSIFVIAFTHK